VKYGAAKPNALLSRSVAGVKGSMLVYAVPGSVRAAREYVDEILKTLEHAVLMANGFDTHGASPGGGGAAGKSARDERTE
jgi:molybdopterin biosynthesis enzyme MoaB